MKTLASILLAVMISGFAYSNPPFTLEIEQISIPGTPAIHSFAFAQSGGKWLFIGGRINGMHGFTTSTSFPKEYSNKRIYVVDPATGQTWSRSIFADLQFWIADQFRSMNMQYVQKGNKLYFVGGYGYDSTSNSLLTFPMVKVIDVQEAINAVINGNSIAPHVRHLNDARMQVTGGEVIDIDDYLYLVGGHKFTGPYRRIGNNQVYTNKIKKFRISDDGISISIADFSEETDTVEFHRRDLNLVPAISPQGEAYAILYGGVFKQGIDMPYLNPIYITGSGKTVDYSYSQQMCQYTCANMGLFDSVSGGMHTVMFGGLSLNSFDENTNEMVTDSLVPFINDIAVISRAGTGSTSETVINARFSELVGTNAKFILNPSVPAYENGVVKLKRLTGRTFAGYMFGGIRGTAPNFAPSFASDRIYRIYITPEAPLPVELTSFSSVVNGRDVTLNWSTSSELNNRGFAVERMLRSETGVNAWGQAGYVSGAGTTSSAVNYSFSDRNLASGRYAYRLRQEDLNGNFEYHNLAGEAVIGVPQKFALHQNYPNPFNPVTNISFDLPADGEVSLKVYDVRGSEVATLASGFYSSGYYTKPFSAGDGIDLSSGVYFAVLRLQPASGGAVYVSKIRMALVK